MSKPVEELEGSELGTKDFWENSYTRDIANYRNHGDVGEIWFDEDSQNRIITWISRQEEEIKEDDAIIDLGCGNGMMLIELAREGYTNLTGIDYSPKAIELSKTICQDQELPITFKVVDLMSETEVTALGQFKVVHDKGTYDAISLHPDDAKTMRALYIRHVHKMLRDDGLFVLTSCNWTESELVESFGELFQLRTLIPTPTFKFGGKVGSVVTSIVFVKKL